jgi:hypothetical protein
MQQRRLHRRVCAVLFGTLLSLSLAGCESFDPQSLTDWLPDGKKKLQGERKDVFPGGVPGVTQGVPSEYVKGAQQQPAAAVELPPEPAPEEKPKAKPKPKAKTAARTQKPQPQAQPSDDEPEPQQAQGQPQAAAPWPSTPQQGAPQQSPWPAPAR